MGNVLIMQSGGSTAVLNRSLVGAIQSSFGKFDNVFGSIRGIQGLIHNNLVNLTNISDGRLSVINNTPGAFLGSTRHKIIDNEIESILNHLQYNDIAACIIIGGNDSAETGHSIFNASIDAGIDLSIVNIPKTIDNDLRNTDHSLGYGSAALFVAMSTMGIGRDSESMGQSSPIAILEVMGRDTGWLASASILGKKDQRAAPHIVVTPEYPISEDKFLDLLESAYSSFGFAVAVVSENARSDLGVFGNNKPWFVDDFGHPYYEGAGQYLSRLASKTLGLRVRFEKPGTIQRSLVATISKTDALEASMAGEQAIYCAKRGETDIMVTLERSQSNPYNCVTGTTTLEKVAGKISAMPESYFSLKDYMPTESFINYASPLIGDSLPLFERLVDM